MFSIKSNEIPENLFKDIELLWDKNVTYTYDYPNPNLDLMKEYLEKCNIFHKYIDISEFELTNDKLVFRFIETEEITDMSLYSEDYPGYDEQPDDTNNGSISFISVLKRKFYVLHEAYIAMKEDYKKLESNDHFYKCHNNGFCISCKKNNVPDNSERNFYNNRKTLYCVECIYKTQWCYGFHDHDIYIYRLYILYMTKKYSKKFNKLLTFVKYPLPPVIKLDDIILTLQ